MKKYRFLSISCAFFSLFVTPIGATSLDQTSGIFKSNKQIISPSTIASEGEQHHLQGTHKVLQSFKVKVPAPFQTAVDLGKDTLDLVQLHWWDPNDPGGF